MNRKEAEAIVRQVGRTCRGLPVLPYDTRVEYHTAFTNADKAKNWEAAKAVCLDTEKAVGLPDRALLDYDWEGLNRRFALAVFAHGDQVGQPCGADVNDIICAGRFDGQQHPRKCPKCGAEDMYGAPVFGDEAVEPEQ